MGGRWRAVTLERADGLTKMRDLPEGDPQIKQPQPRHRAAHPAGCDRLLQALQSGLLRRVEQKIVVAPIAQPEGMQPRQQREHNANFEAQDNVEDDCELC